MSLDFSREFVNRRVKIYFIVALSGKYLKRIIVVRKDFKKAPIAAPIMLFKSSNSLASSTNDAYKDGKFSRPTNLGAVINSSSGEHDPFIAPDESFLIYNSDRPGGYGEADLYISCKKDGVWQSPVNMGSTINTSSYEYCSNMTQDGKFFFYSSEQQVKWVNSSVLSQY